MENRTNIVIVQHPRERFHPFNTARMAELGLSRVQLVVDHDGCLRRGEQPLPLPPDSGILYPSPGARDIAQLRPDERPKALVVVDGTWHHARTLYRDIPRLHDLPHFTFASTHTSRFAIRRQPQSHCLSTIESIVFALEALEPDTDGLSALLGAFERMVQQQLLTPKSQGRTPQRRARESRAIPRALIEDYPQLVVAYGESLPTRDRRGRQLLYWVALRPATGEAFECFVAADSVSALHIAHMDLSAQDVARGVPRAEFVERWRKFLLPSNVLAVWNKSTLDVLRVATDLPERAIVLKGAYCNLHRHRGSLEDIVGKEGLITKPAAFRGRANQRLANATSLVHLLRRVRQPCDT